MTHTFTLQVYYEDTDMGGIVYHANYLRFIERARSQWVKSLGIDQIALREAGVVFVVRHMDCDYLSAARFEDELTVETRVLDVTGARLRLEQVVLRDRQVVFTARVTVVSMEVSGRPTRLPAEIRALGRGL
ncbi:tol-pal system-associated acyl-CoA thioesterase [Marinibacterium profundimaris]|uniref:Thioesterase n=1 Tax=Marinibacterium profundimaris TaxID=1679460 RepID=A0A225NDW5_9RHOB|nr:tol-pal system-associated acyl-CoA thioesterase [Marinibacterium profundimaris]OWU70421.1 thioesterase [Marinibacterium profundimaris]